jgi:hypothetical protein
MSDEPQEDALREEGRLGEERRKYKRLLCDLLAYIHRDGGHHTAEVGLDKSVEDAIREVTLFNTYADDAAKLRSLLTELWEGVRIHGLQAPPNGRDGERLIHAYCGGIVKLKNELEQYDEWLRFATLNLHYLGASKELIDKLKKVLKLDRLDQAFPPPETILGDKP